MNVEAILRTKVVGSISQTILGPIHNNWQHLFGKCEAHSIPSADLLGTQAAHSTLSAAPLEDNSRLIRDLRLHII
jgi:hypothetical protein